MLKKTLLGIDKMAKKNEILEEQRRSRKELLELKKMQGSAKSKEPSFEEKVMPKTFKGKLKNFWNYHKVQIIVAVILMFLVAVSIKACANTVKPDMNVILFTYTGSNIEQNTILSDYFESVCADINKDGEVYVNIIDCSFNKNSTNGQYKIASQNKLQALLAADYSSILVITDSDSYEFFKSDNMKGLFLEKPYKFSEAFYNKLSKDKEFYLKNLQISCRAYYDTVLEEDKSVKPIFDEALKIIENIKKTEVQ